MVLKASTNFRIARNSGIEKRTRRDVTLHQVKKAVKLILKGISHLPLAVLYGISGFLFFIAYRILRYRRQVVEDNIRQSFPEWNRQAQLQAGRDFYRTLCDLVVETIKLMSMTKEMLMARTRLADSAGVRALRAEKGSVMLLTGHFTNWEWVGNMLGLEFPEKKVQIIYLRLTNKLFNEVMYSVRSRFGNQPIQVEQAFRQIYATREQPTLSCFVADQCPMEHQIGWWGTFFHRQTPWFSGPEKLARRMDLNVYFIHIRKLKRGRYEVDFEPISTNSAESPEHFITETYSRIMENSIRAQPETWLWSHRRWKRSPKPL
jgi:KDO2-lipid IV(A) lauroyltransferase